MGLVCFNGEFKSEENISLGLNRAFKYGDGLFESIRIHEGKIVWWNEHLQRLIEGLQFLKIKRSITFEEDLFLKCKALIERNNINEDGRMRITVFRTGTGLYSPNSNQLSYLIEANPIENKWGDLNKKGLSVGISKEVELYYTAQSKYKTINALPYVRASIEKQEKKWDEIILKNKEGYLAEASSANLFVVINKEILTPSLESGCLAGVARSKVIELIEASNFVLNEGLFYENILEQADEIFLSNCSNGIRWVSNYSNNRYFHKVSAKILDLLASK